MERFNLEQILRYLVIGFVIIGLAFICEPQQVSPEIKELGSVGIPVAAFTIGALIYLIYRAIFYTLLIIPLKDRLTVNNYRVYLKNSYNVGGSLQAEVLWFTIRDLHLKETHQEIRIHSSGIHLLYMSAILFCAASIYSLSVGQQTKACYLVISSLMLGISGLISDIFVEHQELLLLKKVEPNEIRTVVDRMMKQDKNQKTGKGQ